jgi:hypothetical protein
MISQMAFYPYATSTWALVIHLPPTGSQTNVVYPSLRGSVCLFQTATFISAGG